MFYSKDVSFLAATWAAPLQKNSAANVSEGETSLLQLLSCLHVEMGQSG